MNDCGVLAETETRESRLVNCINLLDMVILTLCYKSRYLKR